MLEFARDGWESTSYLDNNSRCTCLKCCFLHIIDIFWAIFGDPCIVQFLYIFEEYPSPIVLVIRRLQNYLIDCVAFFVNYIEIAQSFLKGRNNKISLVLKGRNFGVPLFFLKNNTSKYFEAQSLNKTTTFKTCAPCIRRNDAHATDTPNAMNSVDDTIWLLACCALSPSYICYAKHT